MKIKMADVARYLGISKATVSLAVNGKPGVNEETRQKIFQCIEDMKKNQGKLPETPVQQKEKLMQMIKVVIVNHRKQVVCDPELDLWSEVLSVFEREVRKRGYLYGLTYLNETEGDWPEVIRDCNMNFIAGIILFGTELSSVDHKAIRQIQKPVVIYDYEIPDGSYSSVCINNARAVEMAVDVLEKAGASSIYYFQTGKEIYNFVKRREAFLNQRLKQGVFSTKEDMVSLGNSIGEMTEQAFSYFSTHSLPEGAVFENYQVSIGVLTALRQMGLLTSRKMKMVGIDEVPDYIVPDIELTQIRIPHAERALMAISLLDKEITLFWKTKIRIFAEPELLNAKI